MPSQDAIDVRIVADGQVLREYRDPHTDLDDNFLCTRYIEVKTGQKFGTRIKCLQGFELKWAKFVAASMQIDNHRDHAQLWWGDTSHMHYDRAGKLLSDYVLTENFNSHEVWNEELGEWTRVHWAFGALGTNEDDPKTCKLAPSEVSQLGCIYVAVFRAKREYSKTPIHETRDPIEPLNELPEAMLKGSGIKNNTKFTTAGTIPAPEPYHYDYGPMKGKNGCTYHFKFLYRTKKTLQNIGCLLRSPSPPPDTRLMLERTEDTLRQEKLKSARLQARLASLEAASREGSHTIAEDTPPRSVKREGIPGTGNFTGVKRRRSEMDDDEPAEVAPPAKKPTVIIDLTDD